MRPSSKRDWLGQDGPGDLGRGKVQKGEFLLMGKRVTTRCTGAFLQGEGGTEQGIEQQFQKKWKGRISNDISLPPIAIGGVRETLSLCPPLSTFLSTPQGLLDVTVNLIRRLKRQPGREKNLAVRCVSSSC